MPRQPDILCAGGCGRLLWRGTGSLEAPTCRRCRALRKERGEPVPWTQLRRCTCCDKEFRSPNGRKTCSEKCRHDRQVQCGRLGGGLNRLSPGTEPRTCESCGKDFTARVRTTRQPARFCSRTCYYAGQRGGLVKMNGGYIRWARPDREFRVRALGIATRIQLADWLLGRDGEDCGICGNPLAENTSFDHIIPRAAGGGHCLVNLRLTHLPCNVRKGCSYGPAEIELVARNIDGQVPRITRTGVPDLQRKYGPDVWERAWNLRSQGVAWREIAEAIGAGAENTGTAYSLAAKHAPVPRIPEERRGRPRREQVA